MHPIYTTPMSPDEEAEVIANISRQGDDNTIYETLDGTYRQTPRYGAPRSLTREEIAKLNYCPPRQIPDKPVVDEEIQ